MNLKDKVKELSKTTPFSEGYIASSLESRARKGLPLNLDLQFFGGSDDDQEDPPGDSGKGDKDEKTPEEIEFDKKVEAEADRKLESAKRKWEKDQETKTQQLIKDALKEKERLSKLSEKEREEEQLTQREKEIAEREAEIERKILRSEAVDDLQEKGLPSEFADFLLGEDAEKTLENINNFKKSFDEAVNTAVKEKLRQDTPPAGGGIGTGKEPSVAQLAEESRLIK